MPSQVNTRMLILIPSLLALGESVCTLMLYLRPKLMPWEVLLVVYCVVKVAFDVAMHLTGLMPMRWSASRIGERILNFTYMAAPVSLLHSVVVWFSAPGSPLRRLLLTALVPVGLCLLEALSAASERNEHVFGRRVALRRGHDPARQSMEGEATTQCGPDI
jgi:hypothetical protein